MNQRVRERVPTPENDNRMNGHNQMSSIPSIASGVAMTTHNLATTPSIFPTTTNNSMPILGTLLLSPIKESDSVNNTLSSGSITVAPTNSILPLNIKTTNPQTFGSLVVSTTKADGEIIPVSITTVPLTATSDLHNTGAIITELPVDQNDSITSSGGKRSAPATPRLGNFFSDFSVSPIPPAKNKIQRQHSVDSNNSVNPNMDDLSTSSNSTISKRQPQVGGKKHSEVYV